MKSWKGWTRFGNTGSVSRAKDATFRHPVLVIDASKFPKDAPEIGSEWQGKITGATFKICGPPIHNGHHWFVASEGQAMMVRIADLKPIPRTAKGEVAGGHMKEALAQAIEVAFAGAMASNDPKAARSIARTICTTLGITREDAANVRSVALHGWMAPRRGEEACLDMSRIADALTALMDLGDT